jgi:hypothetical protein
MAENENLYEMVRKAILAVYAAPSVQEHFVNLGRCLSEWDEQPFDVKEPEGIKLFEDLQSLIAFLDNKNLTAQSDEIFRLILHTFPEKYFPSLPWLKDSQGVDMKLLEDAGFVLDSRNYPDHVQEAFRLFVEQFKLAYKKLPGFIKEVEMNLFKESGSGIAGELFRRFDLVAQKLHETSLKDVPWTVINQLAMQINNSFNAFNAAYTMLKALDEVTLARPSRGLRDNMYRNEKFFLRNFYWQNIDQAQTNKDYTKLVFYIDKYIPLADSGYERSNLLMIRAKALKNISEIPRGLVGKILIVFGLVVIISIIISEPEQKKRLNLDKSRQRIIAAQKAESGNPFEEAEKEKKQKPVPVKSRTNLTEHKPPPGSQNRELTLPEIRHAVFQKIRLDYLAEQNLSDEEKHKLRILVEDYNSRCEFYKYKNKDREKVHWDAKIHAPRIIQDAQDILDDWRGTTDKKSFEELVRSELLNTTNPDHLRRIVSKLRQYGYYNDPVDPNTWNEKVKRALLDFKVSNMGIVDDQWDMKTQKALFGN